MPHTRGGVREQLSWAAGLGTKVLGGPLYRAAHSRAPSMEAARGKTSPLSFAITRLLHMFTAKRDPTAPSSSSEMTAALPGAP